MATSFPITLPTAQGFTRFSVMPRSATALFQSPFTGQQQVFQHPAQYLELTASLPPMNREDAAPILGALMSLQGLRGTFYLGDPSWTSPQGIGTGTPLIAGGSQTGNTLTTDGWTINQTGILKAGDWIQIGSGSSLQLCMVTQDADSDGSGNATLEIFPRIRTAFANNTPITVNNPVGVWRLKSNIEYAIERDSFIYGTVIQAMEAF